MVDLRNQYHITSNRESGFGRYDIMLEPLDLNTSPAIIMEFKVLDPESEQNLTATVADAVRQIHDKKYAATLRAKGIPNERIRIYGFAFQGKNVLIGK